MPDLFTRLYSYGTSITFAVNQFSVRQRFFLKKNKDYYHTGICTSKSDTSLRYSFIYSYSSMLVSCRIDWYEICGNGIRLVWIWSQQCNLSENLRYSGVSGTWKPKLWIRRLPLIFTHFGAWNVQFLQAFENWESEVMIMKTTWCCLQKCDKQQPDFSITPQPSQSVSTLTKSHIIKHHSNVNF